MSRLARPGPAFQERRDSRFRQGCGSTIDAKMPCWEAGRATTASPDRTWLGRRMDNNNNGGGGKDRSSSKKTKK